MTLAGDIIPIIDVGPIFGPRCRDRDTVDRQLAAAAAGAGFMTIIGFPDDIDVGAATRRQLLRLFGLANERLETLSSNRDDPSRPLIYRGWFRARVDRASYFDGIEMGPDVAHGEQVVDASDPLRGATPMPSECDLPGWRDFVGAHFCGMERLSDALMRALARGLGLPEDSFATRFDGGISTLRLLRYPVRSDRFEAGLGQEELYVEHGGMRREIVSESHVDFGFLTLLVQDAVGGFQARAQHGTWFDIPPTDGHIVVNFGKLLERWTGGRIHATEHRVLSSGRERFSLPFFYEPRVDAEIAPLPLLNAESFTPFFYGDHVWASLPRLRRHFGERRPGAV